MKIIVTGGSGFIGSHVVDVLIEGGHEVLIYDLTGPIYGQKCSYAQGDVNDYKKLLNSSRGFDAIYHMAAEANVNIFYEKPVISNYNTSNSTMRA
jgi:UDP-glucose 4-epimerase